MVPAAKTTGGKSGKANERGAPVAQVDEAYIAKQSPEQARLLNQLRRIVTKAVPDTTVAIKWGVPVYERAGKRVCSIAAFKDHLAITLFASPEQLEDPAGRLEGGGKGMRSLKVRTAADIDGPELRRWLKTAAG